MRCRIAITGGLGFIGSALARHMNRDFDVIIVDNGDRQTRNDAQVGFVKTDITNYEGATRALDGADLVIHTAIVQIPRINESKRLGYEVNVLGTQNVCEAVRKSATSKGLILTGSWHTIGERNIMGTVDEKFGFRPDFVEERARLYALSKVAQEAIVRLYEESTLDKVFGVIRIGTALGENMPKETAANMFIERALRREPLTPYEHSMYRPMLYVDVNDVCRAFESYAVKILEEKYEKTGGSLAGIVNLFYPEPITILDLAETIKRSFIELSEGKIIPEVLVKKTGEKRLHSSEDKNKLVVDVSKARDFLGIEKLTHPKEVIDRIVKDRLSTQLARIGT